MYTANIISKQVSSGLLIVVVEYSNGKEVMGETISIRTAGDLDSFIKQRIVELSSVEDLNGSLVLGAYTPTAPPIIPDAPPNELDVALKNLRRLNELVGLGVKNSDDADVLTAIQSVKDKL